MLKFTFETYQLSLTDKPDKSCSIKLAPLTGTALKTVRRKIYIIQAGKNILYVGEANTSIKTRFQRGCVSYNHFVRSGHARGGYKGYKWLNILESPVRKMAVHAITFESDCDNNRGIVEAIEGELVYLIRRHLGYWPKFQNEIHFHNVKYAKETAKNIWEKLPE